MNISVITIQDKDSLDKQLAKNLVSSLELQHCPLTIIDTYDPKLGLLSKIYKVYDHLLDTASFYEPNDVIVFVDAHDVIFRPETSRFHLALLSASNGKV